MLNMWSRTHPLLRLWIHSPTAHLHASVPKHARLSLLLPTLRQSQSTRNYSCRTSGRRTNDDPPHWRTKADSEPWQAAFVRWAQQRWKNRHWPTPTECWTSLKSSSKFIFHTFNFFCAAHLFCSKVLFFSLMMGPSMLPTFANEGDIILEDRITYRLFPEKLARGDVIVAESPLERGHKICKRVFGLPGDVVCVDPTGRFAPSTEHVVVPKGHVWLIGDNASLSRDSRTYGPVPIALIKGRVLARIWPPTKIDLFPGKSSVTSLT